MKKLVIVEPEVVRTTMPDGKIHSRYFYPDLTGIKEKAICFDRTHPSGDPVCRQMWIIEGRDEDVLRFLAEPNVKEITPSEANILGKIWKPEEVDITDILPNIEFRDAEGNKITGVRAVMKKKPFAVEDWVDVATLDY